MHSDVPVLRSFTFSVTLAGGANWQCEYRSVGAAASATVTVRDSVGNATTRGDHEGLAAACALVARVDPMPLMSSAELLRRSCAALLVSDDAIACLEVAVVFADGTGVEARAG